MSKFYFDAYNAVQADDFEGSATFIDGDTETLVMFFNNTCKLPFDINLREHYKIRVEDEEYPISYRFIVQTEQFERENTYDGPLGSIYHKDYTDKFFSIDNINEQPLTLKDSIWDLRETAYPSLDKNKANKDLKIAVEVGLVVGITPAITPKGSATVLIPFALSSQIIPQVFSFLCLL